MKESETTKQGKTAGGAHILTSSPAGHEEMAEQAAAEQLEGGVTSVPAKRIPNPMVSHAQPTRRENPKKPHSRP